MLQVGSGTEKLTDCYTSFVDFKLVACQNPDTIPDNGRGRAFYRKD